MISEFVPFVSRYVYQNLDLKFYSMVNIGFATSHLSGNQGLQVDKSTSRSGVATRRLVETSHDSCRLVDMSIQ